MTAILDKPMVEQLRDAVTLARDPDKRRTLAQAADSLDFAIQVFAAAPIPSNLRDVNAAWSFGFRLLGPDQPRSAV